jgi:hypothetical protein
MAVDVLDFGGLGLLEIRDEFGPFVLLFHPFLLSLIFRLSKVWHTLPAS